MSVVSDTNSVEERELRRLDFIEQRDGQEARTEFARRGAEIYLAALTEYGREYRQELLRSITVYSHELPIEESQLYAKRLNDIQL